MKQENDLIFEKYHSTIVKEIATSYMGSSSGKRVKVNEYPSDAEADFNVGYIPLIRAYSKEDIMASAEMAIEPSPSFSGYDQVTKTKDGTTTVGINDDDIKFAIGEPGPDRQTEVGSTIEMIATIVDQGSTSTIQQLVQKMDEFVF